MVAVRRRRADLSTVKRYRSLSQRETRKTVSTYSVTGHPTERNAAAAVNVRKTLRSYVGRKRRTWLWNACRTPPLRKDDRPRRRCSPLGGGGGGRFKLGSRPKTGGCKGGSIVLARFSGASCRDRATACSRTIRNRNVSSDRSIVVCVLGVNSLFLDRYCLLLRGIY